MTELRLPPKRSTRLRRVDMLERPISERDVADRQALRKLIAECAATPTRRFSSLRTGASFLQSEVSEFHDGLVIPGTRYRVVTLLGTGGMGNVYDVEHVELGKRFVLKALHRGLCNRSELVARLRTEWRALGRLEHPNIVAVTDAGLTELGVSYFVMERLEGETLMARLRRECRLRVPDALRVAEGLFEALGAAHAIGVVHRDIKPPNLFLTRDGGIKLLDFGIAKITDESAAITQRGVAVGTPRYMSPEQARGERVDGRADLYAAGLLMFEMIAGCGPFDDRERAANDLLLAQLTEVPPRLSRFVPEVSAGVEELVAQLLEKDCRARPRSARETAERVRALAGRSALIADTRDVTAAAGYEDPTRLSPVPQPPSRRPRGLPTLRQIDDGRARPDVTTVVKMQTPSDAVMTGVLHSPADIARPRSSSPAITLLDATREDVADAASVEPIYETMVDPRSDATASARPGNSARVRTDPDRTEPVADSSEHERAFEHAADLDPITRADGIAARGWHADDFAARITTATPPPVAAAPIVVAHAPDSPTHRRVLRTAVGALAVAGCGILGWWSWAAPETSASAVSAPPSGIRTASMLPASARPALSSAPVVSSAAAAPPAARADSVDAVSSAAASAHALPRPSAAPVASGAKARHPGSGVRTSLLPASGL